MLNFLISIIFLSCASRVTADVQIRDGQIYLTGNLHQGQQLTDFKAALAELPGTKTIFLERCLGGTVLSALVFSEVIKSQKLMTVAKGQVSSACAVIFTAGVQRKFADGIGANYLSFHSARLPDSSGPATGSSKRLLDLLITQTDGKLKPHIVKLIFDSWNEASGVVFSSRDYYFYKRSETLYCDGSQGSNFSLCKQITDADPYENGILTKP